MTVQKKNLTLKPSLSSQPAAPLEGQNKNNKSLAPSLAKIQLPFIHLHRPAKHPIHKNKIVALQTHTQSATTPSLPSICLTTKASLPLSVVFPKPPWTSFSAPLHNPRTAPQSLPCTTTSLFPISNVCFSFGLLNYSDRLSAHNEQIFPPQPATDPRSPSSAADVISPPPDQTSTSHLHRSFSGHRWQQQPDLPSAEEKTNREEKRTEGFEQI